MLAVLAGSLSLLLFSVGIATNVKEKEKRERYEGRQIDERWKI